MKAQTKFFKMRMRITGLNDPMGEQFQSAPLFMHAAAVRSWPSKSATPSKAS